MHATLVSLFQRPAKLLAAAFVATLLFVASSAMALSQRDTAVGYWKTIDDVNAMLRNAIAHFFEHYKDLEAGKWVKVLGWEGVDAAHKEIVDVVENYQKSLG